MIALLLALAQAAANEPIPDDVVVVATRDACTVRFADRAMTDAEFNARAAEWKGGKPVRVISRADADLACVRKIASKLFARGVTRIDFVDPQGKPSFPFDPPAGLPRYDSPLASGGSDHQSISQAAARLILQGRCDDARKLALDKGDLDAAAAVVTVCRAPGW
ncbi:MAG: hypothetical protein J0I47_01425 [Sphingomonas sp.]|uniref:hypothetical protein n=1 Tax=Sphingomonas sp. TaxID=28214 RepID=UPI001AD54F94|nr:hypothetical protein [Sphingomonas sp.]MBN8806889.1 hypothetical protein [Sphingomonas sp.]